MAVKSIYVWFFFVRYDFWSPVQLYEWIDISVFDESSYAWESLRNVGETSQWCGDVKPFSGVFYLEN